MEFQQLIDWLNAQQATIASKYTALDQDKQVLQGEHNAYSSVATYLVEAVKNAKTSDKPKSNGKRKQKKT